MKNRHAGRELVHFFVIGDQDKWSKFVGLLGKDNFAKPETSVNTLEYAANLEGGVVHFSRPKQGVKDYTKLLRISDAVLDLNNIESVNEQVSKSKKEVLKINFSDEKMVLKFYDFLTKIAANIAKVNQAIDKRYANLLFSSGVDSEDNLKLGDPRAKPGKGSVNKSD